ncbi:amidase signature domain-containing protein [Microdochium trichocladiopsis]|uniref:Amidase signature domain-containing protein n=1 Tax=Microdochium trichocladiopsis TaxID=1682393 RepID=A0A9P8YCD0_9PEZI|nr:amidase signature domain-containing protein [Microdochium trichocladiopsis]KAH7035888.1 amidase signature domain-containing protein [Microdochium trichocladiopsis]
MSRRAGSRLQSALLLPCKFRDEVLFPLPLETDAGLAGTDGDEGDRLLEKVMAWYRDKGDDVVWTEEFLRGEFWEFLFSLFVLYTLTCSMGSVIVVLCNKRNHDLFLERGRQLKVIPLVVGTGGNAEAAPGPHVLHCVSGELFPVRRLFEDCNDCFVRGVISSGRDDGSDGEETFRWVPGTNDVIDIAGLETGCGSADYRKFQAPRTRSVACVERLLRAGAVMVGKMRCCQWCDGQDPLERYEEPTPVNPRGDGWQKPSGSSSGSAAGAASYPWFDFTVGTDTGGSIRHPAAVNGVYGIRPSRGSVDSAGLVCSTWTDTTGVFARSAKIARDAMMVMTDPLWLEQNAYGTRDSGKPPTKFNLLYAVNSPYPQQSDNKTPKFFSAGGTGAEASTPAGKQLEAFVRALEEHLGCKRREVCLAELWQHTRPPEAASSSSAADLTGWTEKIYQNVVYHDLAKNTVEPFVQRFKQSNARLDYGNDLPEADYQESVRKLRVFGDWVNHHLLPIPSSLSSSFSSTTRQQPQITKEDKSPVTLLVYPQSWGVPCYRDEVVRRVPGGDDNKNNKNNIFWSGFSTYGLSYCSGCPDFTLPVGEVEFRSKVTDTVEKLPVAISLLGPGGCDKIMLGLIAQLEDEGKLRAVNTGPNLFPE